jgi:hypothetical protein
MKSGKGRICDRIEWKEKGNKNKKKNTKSGKGRICDRIEWKEK